MLKLGISGVDDVLKHLGKVQKQITFATAKALTRTAKRIQEAEQREIEKCFDRPVAFTKRSIGITPATTTTLIAKVFVKDLQAKYLLPQIMGGRRAVKKFESRFDGAGYWVPGPGIKLNNAGNIPLNEIKRIAAQLQLAGQKSGHFQRVFIGRPAKQPAKPFAIWAEAKKGKLVPLLIRLDHAPAYSRRFDFYGVAERMVGKTLAEEMGRAVKEAIQDQAGRQLKRAVNGLF